MPAAIDLVHLGNYHIEEDLFPKLQLLFQQMSGNWKVKVNGSHNHAVWEVFVTSPQGKTAHKECFAVDDHCTAEHVLEMARKMAKHLE